MRWSEVEVGVVLLTFNLTNLLDTIKDQRLYCYVETLC